MARLIVKYEELLRLRRDADLGVTEVPRAELRALSAEFPGALRELDRLSIAEIERRLEVLRSGTPDRMLETIGLYHLRMREALRAARSEQTRVEGRRLSALVLARVSEEARVDEGVLRAALGLRARSREA